VSLPPYKGGTGEGIPSGVNGSVER
jgi:hypothetical protein